MVLPDGRAYWTVVDDDYVTVAVADAETGRDPCHSKNWLSTVPETGLTTTRSRNGTLDAQIGFSDALDRMVDPDTRGDPESPLRWTCKSTRALARG